MQKTEEFHRKRRMFCIIGNEIHTAPNNDPRSHWQWFRDEGWLRERPDVFFLKTVRGLYYPETNMFFAFIGSDYSFDKDTIQTVWVNIFNLRDQLGMNDYTQIVFGPKDSSFHGRSYHQLFYGTLTEFVGKIYDQIN